MLKTKRQRAVVLALIAFFCTAATTYVAVDWKRFGGGFLAFLKGKGEQHLASGGQSAGLVSGQGDQGATKHPYSPTLRQMAAAVAHSGGRTGAGGAGHGKPDDDLFVYGNPAAGGIPPGSFIVTQNDDAAAAPGSSPAAESAGVTGAAGGEGHSGAAGSPAPGNGGSTGGDGGIVGIGKAPATPPPSPAAPPPSPAAAPPASTPTPAPAPTQSGTTSSGDDTTPPPVSSPPSPLPPVSAVPEASSLAMMSLGALFLAVAARRKRQNG